MDERFDNFSWNKIKGRLKHEFPVLTDADLLSRKTMQEDLIRMIANKLGKTKKELLEIISKL